MRMHSEPLPVAVVALDRSSSMPAYRQIYVRLRDAIVRGILLPGARLPSARSLASQLATARGTIDLAYALLAGEGYVVARGAAGTVIAPALSEAISRRRARDDIPRRAAAAQTHPPAPVAPFQMGLPALDLFPEKLWTRLTTRRARILPVHACATPDPMGFAPLRQAIVSYLAVSRGILCSPDQVIISSGFQGALGLITRTYLHPRDQVWFENPGYFLARAALEAAGATVLPIPVDEQGLLVEAAIGRAPRARFAYVTPSHQAPLGVSLALPRRLALLAWAAKARAWIIEDDYDSEFRYGSRPLPALKSLDEGGRVLYVGSFSKVLSPGLRLGYLVVPEAEIERMRRSSLLYHQGCAVMPQAVVADFLLEGHFARHIKRMRAVYAERRAALADALGESFGDQVAVQLQAGGMHLIARFENSGADREMISRAAAAGLAPAALSRWYVESRRCAADQGLLLSFTNIPANAAHELAGRLAAALRTSGPQPRRVRSGLSGG